MKLGVISPHLDDAVLSCAQLIQAHPGSQVTTIFASGPAAVHPLTDWDRRSKYFRDGDDVMAARREEDVRSNALLGARVHHLDFWDQQYRLERYGYAGPHRDELASGITELLLGLAVDTDIEAWVLPLGLVHPDHRLAAAAALAFAAAQKAKVFVYAELPYWREDAAELQRALANVGERGHGLAEVAMLASGDRSAKRAAMRRYASQRRPLGRRLRVAISGPERLWRLQAAPLGELPLTT